MDDSKLNIGKEQVDDAIRKEMHDLKLNIGKEQVDDLKKKRILLHLDEEGYTLLVDDGETKKDPSDEEDEFFKSLSTEESQEADEESQEADEEAPFLFGDISELIQKRQQDCGVVIHHNLPKTDC